MIGSVCNGRSQLEIKYTFPLDTSLLKKGIPITVTGIIEKNPPGPVTLKLKSEEGFEVISYDETMAFIDVLGSFRTH